MTPKHKIRKGQIYKANSFSRMVEIIGHKGGKYLTRVLTDRTGVYNGSHTLSVRTIAKHYELVEKIKMVETLQEQREREAKDKERIDQDEKCRNGKHVIVHSSKRGTFCEHCDEPL